MICRIEIEGVDKAGKDTLVGYLDYMSNRQIPISSRGLLSTLVYNDIYNRFMSTDREQKLINGNKETLIVVLYGNPDDILIRCKMSNEPKIDIERDINKFFEYGAELEDEGLNVLYYNTTKETPYNIALDIINKLKEDLK